MGERVLTAAEVADAAAAVRRLLDAIEAGGMTASASVRYRLEGAFIALDALASGRAPSADDLLTE